MGRDSVKSKAGRKKGKPSSRWAKGQSCVSNPETKKYREEASNLYYHQVTSNPLLTASNLASSGLNNDEIVVDDDVLSVDIQSLTVSDGRSLGLTSLGTCKSFASDWSKCSNKAFERFLSKFKLDSALHKDMLSILAATSEIINDVGGTHKETEYFCSFVIALGKCEPEQYHAMLALLSMVVTRIPKPVLRRKFSDFYPKLGSILDDAMLSQDSALIRMCCDILRKFIAVQDPSVIEERPVQNLMYSILKCSIHDNPKVRKKARKAIAFIMDQQNEMKSEGATFLVIGWILDQLCSYPTCGSKTVVDSLGLLQHIWSNIQVVPSTGAKKLFESILRAMSSGDISILKIGFVFFSTMFQTSDVLFRTSAKKNATFVDGLNSKLVTAIWEFKPNWKNEEVFISWFQCVLNGLVKLLVENPTIFQQYIPLLFDVISHTWSANFGQASSKILTDVLPHLVNPDVPNETIEHCFKILSKNLISLPPNQNCLFVLSKFLESLTPSAYCLSAKEILLQLIPVRTTPAVENIIGLFLTAFGMENIWTSVEPEVQRTIILPLVRNNIANESFMFWKNNIFQLLTSENSSNASIKFLVWDAFVGFCKNPSDPTNFPAELLGKTVVECPEVRLSALAALRQVLKWPQTKLVIEKYSKNYLPILFNLYVKEKCFALAKKSGKGPNINDGHSEAVGTTIQEYLPFCDNVFILELTEKALSKYMQAPNEMEKGAILDLLALLGTAETNTNVLEKVYDIASTLISDAGHMKRSYRILVVLLKNEFVSGNIKAKIAELVRANKGKTKSNAEPFRLECIICMAFQNDDWFSEFVPEAILNLLSVNMKARKAAVKFIINVVDNLKEKGVGLDNMMSLVNLGLKSSNAFTCACTIHFLSLVYRKLKPESPMPSIINQCITFILEKKDTTIVNEAFRFLSLNLSLYKSSMGPYASGIGTAIAKGDLPRKETNKILARLIRIFGIAGLKAILPNANDPKMHRRLRNIQKKLKKMKDVKREKAEIKEDEASDGEGYTDEIIESWTGAGSSRASKPSEKLLIKEDLVDFLDPSNITASLIYKPKEAKKEDQFELSSDGKLIIQESSKKKGSQEIESEDEDDFDELFKKPEISRKRKLHGTGSTTSSKRTMKSSASFSSSRSAKSSTKSQKSSKANSGKSQSKRRKGPQSNSSAGARFSKF